MAMMDHGAWNGQDHNMTSTGEDDFNQFLEMGAMSNIGDGALPFEFHDYSPAPNSNPGSTSILHHHSHRDNLDTPMAGTDMSPMTTAPNHPSIPAHMLPPPHQRTTGDSISDIDAQIQFLQQQRIEQQQRQLEEQQRRFHEQQAAFFAQQQQQQQRQQRQQQSQPQSQHHLSQQQLPPHQQNRNIVPPTPQSLELQASNGYYPQRDQAHSSGMFDTYPQLKEHQDMAFTPLVSPAVTPLDAHFSVDSQFTVPGAYFSPLTSPALHAQNDPMANMDGRQSSRATASPRDLDTESPPATSGSVDLSKKVRKSNVSKARKSRVAQSPITKPQRKKTASTPIMNAQILGDLAESAVENSARPLLKPSAAASTDDSENASVSPEALSEMPPPPVPQPRSARQSPYIQPQQSQPNTNGGSTSAGPAPLAPHAALGGKPSPATPASLFKISPRNGPGDNANPDQMASEQIESFELPESVNFAPSQMPRQPQQQEHQFPMVDAQAETDKTSTETDSAKTPFHPLPSPVFPKPSQAGSASQSPQLTPKSSASQLNSGQRKTPLLGPRGAGKKRPSVSSVQVSPALRPRISPSIKPLLPGKPGLSSEDTTQRLLMSKSNYQNILEGNTIPGVSYPSELSTNLTSKRTSHKIAEQGRRNRINSALQEIATLLPKTIKDKVEVEGGNSSGSGDKKESKQANGPNSKASTVELAIEYIKQLQAEVELANHRADEAEKKLSEQGATVD